MRALDSLSNYALETALPYMANILAHTDDPNAALIRVELPNEQNIESTHTTELNLPILSKAARKAHVF